MPTPWSVPWLPFSVMRRPNSEKLQDQRVVEQALVLQIVVEREQAVVQRRHQVVVRAVGRVDVLRRVRVEAAGRHVEDARADRPASSRRRRPAAPGRSRCSDTPATGDSWPPSRRDRAWRAPPACCRRRRRARAGRPARATRCAPRSIVPPPPPRRRSGSRRRTPPGSRSPGPRVCAWQHVRQAAGGVPADQRIDRRRQRIEIAADPAESLTRCPDRRWTRCRCR